MPPKKKGIRKTARPRIEANEKWPTTLPSPTRYDESESHAYLERGELVWKTNDSGLTLDQIEKFLESTKNLNQDIALSILLESKYDISSAVEKCTELEQIPDLSLLEARVLLAASPVPYTIDDGDSESWIDPKKHILELLPRIKPAVIMDYFHRISRGGCMPLRGRQPNADGLGLAKSAGFATKKDDSSLHKQEERRRSLRSAAITPMLPRRVGKRDNLAISMAGFDERTSTEDDLSTQRISFPFLLLNRNGTRSIERKIYLSPIKSSYSPPEKRGRSSNDLPIHPSPLIQGEASLPSSSLPHDPIPSSSSSFAVEEFTLKTKRNPLEITMNWSPGDNRSNTRIPSRKMMESYGENKAALASGNDRVAMSRIDVDNDGPIEMMDVDEGSTGAVTADPRSGKHSERADEEAWNEMETNVKSETDTINSNSQP